jgi:hypothetical protein
MQLAVGCAEIAVIPAIESFHLENAGVVSRASMNFPGKITFVFRQRRAEGETTLMSGLCAAAGLPLTRGLPPVNNGKPMSIGAKWKRPLRHLDNVDFTPTKPPDGPTAEVALGVVSDLLSRMGAELCAVFGSDTFSQMDGRHLPEVVRLLNGAKCQSIMFVWPEKAGFLLDQIKPSAVYEFVELPDQPEFFRVVPSPLGNP